MSRLLLLLLGLLPAASSSLQTPKHRSRVGGRIRTLALAHPRTWAPQDLTKGSPGYDPIPDDDYIKKYERNPELWPVEFFIIAYRRKERETQVLVRRSANLTSRYGVGTGVPSTRWMLSTQEKPPLGYQRSEPPLQFEASNYPEFPKNGETPSWSYDKIDIKADAFNGPEESSFADPKLEQLASKIRDGLRAKLSSDGGDSKAFEDRTNAVVKAALDKPNSIAAIQGTLRMSGLFAPKRSGDDDDRYVSLSGENAPNIAKIVESTRIYTMFPQMPDPMPLPSTPPEELQEEIATRQARMERSGRDPHEDRHGRKFTHISTSNVSNTIHGVYLILDLSDLEGLDDVPALDLFGKKEIKREWVSLHDLKVDGNEDTKPTFISGFIVRQLLRDGALGTQLN